MRLGRLAQRQRLVRPHRRGVERDADHLTGRIDDARHQQRGVAQGFQAGQLVVRQAAHVRPVGLVAEDQRVRLPAVDQRQVTPE